MVSISELIGQKIIKITGLEKESEEVKIETNHGVYKLYHEQDCCEDVRLEDFELDSDLTGALVVHAEESTLYNEYDNTWTFYKIETNKGGLWLRWLGESNGYYSESIDIEFTAHED